ncbi:hypothetical protein [Gimesia maris]|uniref:hypothetical protein n=1 Tax=Gimesia maris TaxID=122 RepID=UPI0032EB51C7
MKYILEFLIWIPAVIFGAFMIGMAYMAVFGPEIPPEERYHEYLKAECVRRGYGEIDSNGFFRLKPIESRKETQ